MLFQRKFFHFVCFFYLAFSFGCLEKSAEKTFKIGFSQCCADNWRDAMNLEIKRELAFHPELEFEMTVANNSSEKQIQDIHRLVRSGIDLLIVSPNEAGPLSKILDSIYNTGLPLVLVDRKTESNLYTAFVGGDNFEIGKIAATYIAEKHPEGVKAIELQMGMTITPAVQRKEGFRSWFDRTSNDLLLASCEDKIGIEALKDTFNTIISRFPETNSIFAHTDLMARQASEWLSELKIEDKITIVGVDALPGEGNGINMVEKGVIDASISYPTGGAESILISIGILNKLPFSKENTINSIVVDQSNARTIQLQMTKISGLQQNIDQQISLTSALKKIFRTQRNFILLLVASLLASIFMGFFLWQSLKNKQKANQALSAKNQEVMEKQIQLVEMSEELKEATNAKVNFFTNISHELRTPLTLIIGVTDELNNAKGKNGENSTQIRQIQQNSIRLLRLINQLMDFRKIESAKMQLDVAKFNLVDFITAIGASFKPIANQRKITFEIITKKETIDLWFDPDKLDKVIFNLLSNAFKFTPDGGSVTVSILSDEYEKLAKINVEDSGIGISDDELLKIFEPFYQAKNVHFTGTGLGLSLSKSIVELHNGTITVQSIRNRGSRFSICLPLGNEHFSESQISQSRDYILSNDAIYDESLSYQLGNENQREIKPGSGYHVHIIEDNAEIQQFLRRNLEGQYHITQSFTGDEGFSQATDLVPDLILCDLSLPGMEGIEIIKALKNDIRTSHIPIIILTSRVDINQQIEGSQAGAEAFIAKPFNIQLLESTIKNLIHNRILLKETVNKNFIELKENGSINKLDQDFFGKLNAYINDHFTDAQFQINDLCREVNLSRSQLYRKTKSLLGENISDFIQNKRLNKAEYLLTTTAKTISEIAYESGFASPDYFSTVFKQKYNLSPSQFRKENEN
ncbi:MAG: substrate-binding domain-containing protein [Saprospiraceae bacterium]|nr:substrate-binding domain-containing protein [Saprospiraceae bacterium]